MNKTTFFVAALLTILSATVSNAQTSTTTDTVSKRPQGVFFELLGPGGIYSANYDTRFNKTTTGLGIRVGLSYTQISEASLFTLPVQLNYLLGKNEKFFEMGLGATYGSATVDFGSGNDEVDETASNVFGTMTFGYRKQPRDGGFMFRIGASPVFGKGFFVPYYGYLSLGYSF